MATILVCQLCFIVNGIVTPSGGTITLDINSASGNVSGSGTTRCGGTTGAGVGASIGTRCSYLTQLWIFLVNYGEIIKGLGLRSYEVCRNSNVSPMRACEKHVHECVG